MTAKFVKYYNGLPSRNRDSSKENVEWTLTHREVVQVLQIVCNSNIVICS
jgi:hypothetical protein